MCAPQSGQLRDVHGVIQRREEGGRRQRWRVETEVEGGDRGDLVERKESPRRERAVKPVISLPSKSRY